MSVTAKTNGAEYKSYIADNSPEFWPANAYMDDVLLTVNGTDVDDSFDPDSLLDTDSVVIQLGTYYRSATDDDPISLITHFKRWRKAQTTVYLSVEAHKDKADALKAAIKANGGKVV